MSVVAPIYKGRRPVGVERLYFRKFEFEYNLSYRVNHFLQYGV